MGTMDGHVAGAPRTAWPTHRRVLAYRAGGMVDPVQSDDVVLRQRGKVNGHGSSPSMSSSSRASATHASHSGSPLARCPSCDSLATYRCALLTVAAVGGVTLNHCWGVPESRSLPSDVDPSFGFVGHLVSFTLMNRSLRLARGTARTGRSCLLRLRHSRTRCSPAAPRWCPLGGRWFRAVQRYGRVRTATLRAERGGTMSLRPPVPRRSQHCRPVAEAQCQHPLRNSFRAIARRPPQRYRQVLAVDRAIDRAVDRVRRVQGSLRQSARKRARSGGLDLDGPAAHMLQVAARKERLDGLGPWPATLTQELGSDGLGLPAAPYSCGTHTTSCR